MGDDITMHRRVDFSQIFDLEWCGLECRQARCSWRAESIVLEEPVSIEEPNFPNGSLRNKIQTVGTRSAQPDHRDDLIGELVADAMNAGAARRCVDIIE